jgi:hypothetical protein
MTLRISSGLLLLIGCLLLAGCMPLTQLAITPIPPFSTAASALPATRTPAPIVTALYVAPTVSPPPQPSPSLTPAANATAMTLTPTNPPAPTVPASATVTPPTGQPPTSAAPTWHVETLLVAPGQPGRLYALEADSIGPIWAFPSDEVRLMISDDYARTWASFPGGLPVPAACMINVNLDYFPPTALYASTCQGLYIWQASGWQERSDRVTNLIAVVYGQPDQIWAAEPAKAIIRSNDGGRTWTNASAGLVNFGGMVSLGIDPQDANTVYGMIRPKYAGSYLRRANGSQWQTLPTPLNNVTVEMGMAIDGATGALYVTTQIMPGQLWRSPNPNAMNMADVKWELVHDFGPNTSARLLASGWSPQGMALYANIWPLTPLPGGGYNPGAPALHRSPDAGVSWESLATP